MIFDQRHAKAEVKLVAIFLTPKQSYGRMLFIICLIIFSPLKIGCAVFIPGIILYVLGLVGFVVALFNFKSAPPDQPITSGLYRISRNPQQLMFYISFIGICIAIGSWLALFVQIISSIFLHARILAEEKACIEQYGDSYRGYMERVPRYLLFF